MINKYVVICLTFIFLSTCAQILLKKSANKNHSSIIKEYVNFYVITAYSIFVINTVVSVYLFKFISLKQEAILQTSSYVFIIILGRIFLGEEVTRRKLIGIALIVVGLITFNL